MAEPGVREPEAAADRHWRLRHLPVLLLSVGLAAVLAAAVGGLTGGGAAAVGATTGVGITALSYALSTVVLAWADRVNPQLVLPFGVGLYAAKFSLLGGVMVAVASSGWAGLAALCWGIAVGVVVWTGVHIWWISVVHPRQLRERER